MRCPREACPNEFHFSESQAYRDCRALQLKERAQADAAKRQANDARRNAAAERDRSERRAKAARDAADRQRRATKRVELIAGQVSATVISTPLLASPHLSRSLESLSGVVVDAALDLEQRWSADGTSPAKRLGFLAQRRFRRDVANSAEKVSREAIELLATHLKRQGSELPANLRAEAVRQLPMLTIKVAESLSKGGLVDIARRFTRWVFEFIVVPLFVASLSIHGVDPLSSFVGKVDGSSPAAGAPTVNETAAGAQASGPLDGNSRMVRGHADATVAQPTLESRTAPSIDGLGSCPWPPPDRSSAVG